MPAALPLMMYILLGGCAPIGFEANLEGGGARVEVSDSQDTVITAEPIQFRMRPVESRLVLWIDNLSDTPVELLGNSSEVVDPEGESHPVAGQTIAPGASLKLILPPMALGESQPAAASPSPVGSYDRPGFIPVPGSDGAGDPYDQHWKWDSGLDVELNLSFEQADHQFQRHLSLRKVRKQVGKE
jgi:hypothetical protein